MKIPKHPTLIARHLQARIKDFHIQGPLVAASLVAFRRKCGRPGCHCQSGQGHPAYHLTYKQQGKTRSVYVPVDLVPEVQQWVKEYQRIKGLLRHLSKLAMAKIQTHTRSQRRKRGRS